MYETLDVFHTGSCVPVLQLIDQAKSTFLVVGVESQILEYDRLTGRFKQRFLLLPMTRLAAPVLRIDSNLRQAPDCRAAPWIGVLSSKL